MAEERVKNKEYTQQGLINHQNLVKRVQSLHQERIRALQKEMVKISLQQHNKHNMNSILAEINGLRKLLKYSNK